MRTSVDSGAAGEPPPLRRDSIWLLATGAGVFMLAAAGQWTVGSGLSSVMSSVLTGMWAGLLLGVLMVHRPPPWLVLTHAAIAMAAGVGGVAVLAGAPVPAAMQAASLIAGALICHWLLRWKRVEPAGLLALAPFAQTAVLAAAVLPASALLVAMLVDGSRTGPQLDWLGAALGVLTMLPLVLAGPSGSGAGATGPSRRIGVVALAWLPLLFCLWWRPDLLVLGMLPIIAAAAWLGPRWTALLVLLAGLSVTIFVAASVAGDVDGVLLLACGLLPTAQSIAILGGQRLTAERAMNASQDHLRALTERSPMLIAMLDVDGRHRSANRSYVQWLGKETEQVLEQSLGEVFGECSAITAPFQRAVCGQRQRQQIDMPDGRALDLQFEPRFSPEGPVDGVHLLAQDASWRGAHERALDSLLAGAIDPTLVLDAAGSVVRSNDQCQALLGVSAADLRGAPLTAWLQAASADAVAAALPRLIDEGERQRLPQELELHVLGADDVALPVELQLSAMYGPRGTQVLVALQDLRPQLAREALMIGARNQAETTLNAIGEAVVACDLQQCITVFNPAAVLMSGWSEGDALGKPLSEVIRFIDAQTSAELPSLLGAAITRNTAIRKHPDKLLLCRDGKRAAVAESAAPMRDRFGQTNGGVVLLHDVSHSQAQAQTLTHQAQHDHLTGLPNRVLLHDRLSQALAQMDRGYKGALLYLDLDKFKPINDRLGHPVGDRVLQEVAKRLRECVREDDTVSRQGGDEFVLLLVRLADPRDAARVAGKLIEAIERPIQVEGHELSVSASIGIALFPQDGSDTGTVTRHADAALYHAKDGGRGRYSYFTDIMRASAEERMRTEHDLRVALSNGDFLLAWQPQLHRPEQRIAGVEALLRWGQSDGTVVLPDDFLQVAEETGLMVQIDEWVLLEACRQNRRWQIDGQPRGIAPLPVSVNVSLARLDAERLLAHVRAVLDETGLEPCWLEIEFKAAQLFSQDQAGQSLVAALKALGVRVAVDDFGSGQSSLGDLARFDFDTLKIDRSFIQRVDQDAHSRAVIRAVVGIGHAM
nr:EAL domain-containing protein [Lysobacter sp.]